jgi:hypothetical protein
MNEEGLVGFLPFLPHPPMQRQDLPLPRRCEAEPRPLAPEVIRRKVRYRWVIWMDACPSSSLTV